VIGVDTNVLVRYLTQDDPRQSRLAVEFVEMQLSADHPGHISLVALAEMVWVLSSRFGASREQLITAVATLASDARFVVQDEPAVWLALEACEHETLDLPDALVRYVDRHHGCERTATFDRRAARYAGFQLLGAKT
jgi:predicted nucleic-acid-binding protein